MNWENFKRTPDGLRILVDATAKNYDMEVASGNIPGDEVGSITGKNLGINNTSFETLWDQGGNYVRLTSDTQLYVSSTSAADVAVDLVVQGLDEDYVEVVRTVTVGGQAQVPLSGLITSINRAVVISSTSAVGEIYIAEADTLTGGVPDTASKIKSKICLAPSDSGEFASDGTTHNGFFTVPAGKRFHSIIYHGTTPKNDDVRVQLWIRPQGGSWLNVFSNWAYQSVVTIELTIREFQEEKLDMELRVLAGSVDSEFEANFQYILREIEV
mgnify:CR=1 FL=1